MKEGDLYNGEVLEKGWSVKTDGNSDFIIIRDPEYSDGEGGTKRKIRHVPTNITPKKKKRKKVIL
jgi:hypothetical protein